MILVGPSALFLDTVVAEVGVCRTWMRSREGEGLSYALDPRAEHGTTRTQASIKFGSTEIAKRFCQ